MTVVADRKLILQNLITRQNMQLWLIKPTWHQSKEHQYNWQTHKLEALHSINKVLSTLGLHINKDPAMHTGNHRLQLNITSTTVNQCSDKMASAPIYTFQTYATYIPESPLSKLCLYIPTKYLQQFKYSTSKWDSSKSKTS